MRFVNPLRRPHQLLTLAFIVRKGVAPDGGKKVLLGWKKRGFGMGKWNGFGGKLEPTDASIAAAAVREVKEEIHVDVDLQHLESCGMLLFSCEEGKKVREVHVFLIHQFSGEPMESDEMKPQWYDVRQIPFNSMWVDDRYWLPHVLSGKSVQGHFHFAADEETLLDYELQVSPATAVCVCRSIL